MSLRAPIQLYQQRGNVLTVAPASEPVTASELRDHMIVDATTLPDGAANTLIEEARQSIEDMTGLAFINQTWRMTIDRWPQGREEWWDGIREGHISQLYGPGSQIGYVALPRYPLSSITSITTYDEASNATSVTVANVFDVDTQQTPGRIVLKSGQTWPVATRPSNAIQIVYVAGYGASAANVPAPLKRAIKQLAAYMYSHRGDACDVSDAYHASGAARTLGIYKVARI